MFRVYLQGNNNKISLKKPFPCGLHNADRAKPGAQGIKYRAQILAHQVKLKLLRPPFKLDSSKGL